MVSYSKSYTLPGNDAADITLATIPSGYSYFCYYTIDTGNQLVAFRMMKDNIIFLANISTSTQNGTLHGAIICIRNTGYLS